MDGGLLGCDGRRAGAQKGNSPRRLSELSSAPYRWFRRPRRNRNWGVANSASPAPCGDLPDAHTASQRRPDAPASRAHIHSRPRVGSRSQGDPSATVVGELLPPLRMTDFIFFPGASSFKQGSFPKQSRWFPRPRWNRTGAGAGQARRLTPARGSFPKQRLSSWVKRSGTEGSP